MRLFFFFLLAAPFLNAQEIFLGHSIQFTPEAPPLRNFDAAKYSEQLMRKYRPIISDDDLRKDFVNTLLQSKTYYLSSNTEYEQWDSATAYLQKVLDHMKFKEELTFKPNIKIVRDASVNAHAFEDGTIYVNAGLLARSNSEAEVAAILGHEIGHVIKQHNYQNFKIRRNYFKAVAINMSFSRFHEIGGALLSAVFSSELTAHEKESDAIALEALKASDYNSEALSKVFERFRSLEEKQKALKTGQGNRFSFYYLQTHPSSEKRSKRSASIDSTGRNFLVDSTYFFRLKQQCIDESINLLFEDYAFDDCNELAFGCHLKEPEDPFYLFYLTECTRRLVQKNYKLGKEPFITYRYRADYAFIKPKVPRPYVATGYEVVPHRDDFNHAILYQLNSPILATGPADAGLFAASPILNTDTLPFYTYTDALDYFKLRSEAGQYYLNTVFFSDTISNINYQGHKEKHFNRLMKTVSDYREEPDNGRVLWIVSNASHSIYQRGVMDNDIVDGYIHSDYVYSHIKELDTAKVYATNNNINFNERCVISFNVLNLVSSMLPSKYEGAKPPLRLLEPADLDPEYTTQREVTDLNMGLVMPEVVEVLSRYNYKAVVFTSVDVSQTVSNDGLNKEIQKWEIKHYYLNARTNKVKKSTTQLINYSKSDFYSNIDIPYSYDINALLYQTLKNAGN